MKQYTTTEQIAQLVDEYSTFPLNKKGKRIAPDSFKIKTVKLCKVSKIPYKTFSKKFNLALGTIDTWARKLKESGGIEAAGFIHGRQVRMCLATKCNAVRRHVEHGELQINIAKDLNVNTKTLSGWVTKYRHTYKQYVDAPTGIPYIASKQVIGTKNIHDIQKVLNKQAKAINDLVSTKGIQLSTTVLDELNKTSSAINDELKDIEMYNKVKSKYKI
jgi:transposase-like protein